MSEFVNHYEMYRKIEDLPVKVRLLVPPVGVKRKGIIQFHHGMSEHSGRYLEVMEYFREKGYVCAIHDVRGHGESMKDDSELGYIGENGAALVVEDAHAVTAFLKNNFPDLPFILCGHSFGSMVVRAYIKKYDYELDRAFIVGSPANNKFKIFGLMLIELLTIFKKETEVSDLVAGLFENQYDKKYRKYCEEKKIKYRKGGHVCSAEEVVDKAIKDRKCFFKYTLNGYYTIMDIMRKVYDGSPSKWALKNKNLKITFLAGTDDVYSGTEGVLSAVQRMKDIGYKNTDYILYEGMYHEILNEREKEKVYADMYNMLEKL